MMLEEFLMDVFYPRVVPGGGDRKIVGFRVCRKHSPCSKKPLKIGGTSTFEMTLEELKQTEWYKSRPPSIQEAICKLPPIHLYKFKNTGKQCVIIAYEEGGTCTVRKTGVGGPMAEMGLGVLDTNAVFGVNLDDLEPWE